MRERKFDDARPLDAIAIGRVCIDINPVDYFQPWKDCQTFKKYVGGSPANISVGLSRLGKKVGFIGCISDDQMGVFCTEYLRKEGVDTGHLVKAKHGEPMGLAFTEIISEMESGLMMYRNDVADLQLEAKDVDEAYISSARILVVSGTALAASPSREAVLRALELAKKHKVAVIFDIDYRPYTWKSEDEVSVYYTLAARQADIIMGSREEYDLTDRLFYPGLSDRETACRWFGEGASVVVIKHGKSGSTAYTEEGRAFSVKPFPVKALKSTGGGDGYGSAFLYGLLEGWELSRCLEFGSASASMLVASHGCSADMPTAEAIQNFIREEKARYGEMVTEIEGEEK